MRIRFVISNVSCHVSLSVPNTIRKQKVRQSWNRRRQNAIQQLQPLVEQLLHRSIVAVVVVATGTYLFPISFVFANSLARTIDTRHCCFVVCLSPFDCPPGAWFSTRPVTSIAERTGWRRRVKVHQGDEESGQKSVGSEFSAILRLG